MNGDINTANIVAFLQEQQQQQNQEEQIQQSAHEDIDNIFYPRFINTRYAPRHRTHLDGYYNEATNMGILLIP